LPTYETETRFRREWLKLTAEQQQAFRRAVEHLVADLKEGKGFRPGLRLKGCQTYPGVFEMTWADDGRATFHYGESIREGQAHIVWRRIGTHEIFDSP